jgi:mono/diheme cytochrome c family protein
MADEMFDAPLRDDERAELLAFVDEPVPAGFADRVVLVWRQEGDDQARGTKSVADAVPLRRRRSVRVAVAAIVSLAAVLLVAWWSRTAMVERSEARERVARLAAPEIAPPAALARMRVDAHALLATNCSPCHDSTASDAESGALDVFDVREARWWLTMSDRQLRVVIDRMSSRDDMTDDDIAGIARYVEAELEFRAGGPT